MTSMIIFIAGVVVIIACVMLDEFLEAYEEWQDNQDQDED
jgi:hypothetical protein